MLGSSPHSHKQDLHINPPPRTTADHHLHHHHRRQLLLYCAQLISNSDFSAAHRLISFLSANSSPSGDSTDRLIHYFTEALSLRLRHHHPSPPLLDPTTLQKSYLSLNQITPFLRFTHLTANQSILETIHPRHSHSHSNHLHPKHIHILDFNIMHGVQWPPFMQAIADHHPSITLRITATGADLNSLRRTGHRLSDFANSLGLNFRFHPLFIPNEDNADDILRRLSAVVLLPDETLAVNCVFYLHRMLINREKFFLLLKKIKSMNPKVITLVEKEASLNRPLFVSRFGEALNYYTAVFESLEATVPPKSRERMEVERVWFGREIDEVVAGEGERHERFGSWEVMMRNAGFCNAGVSAYAVAQAKMLMRLHYPSEGYDLEVLNDCFFLGWRNQPLFSVSAWH